MAELNFNALSRPGPRGFYQGFEQGQEARMAQDTNRTNLEASRFKLDELKRDRDEMLQLREQLKGLGQDPDPSKFLDTLAQTGNPEYVKMAIEGKQKIKDLDAYAKLGVIEPITAAPAMPTTAPAVRMPQAPAPTNALGSGTFGMEAPINAMAARAPALVAPAPTPAPINALAPQPGADQIAPTQQRIRQLLDFARTNPRMASQAMAEAKLLQDQLELFSKRAPNKPAALQELEAYMGMSPEQQAVFEKLQKIKAPGTTTNVAVNSPTGKSLSEPVGKRVDASLAKAEGAAGLMENANMIREALNTGNIIAGPLAGPRTKIAQVLGAAGAGDKEKLQNTLSVAKGLAGLTLESRGELKGQGQVTDTETKLLERARSGDMDMTLDELQQVVNISQRLAKRLWENHQTLLKTMEKDPAAVASIEYYRPTGQLAAPMGIGKSPAEQRKETTRPSLSNIFGQPSAAAR
jgi:hypothetical protein